MSLRQLFPMRAAGLVLAAAGLLAATSAARAEVKLPALFTDHMVLQRDQPNRVWGWAKEGDTVTV
ncbi:MAG TPA: sialate O-acetylesterase, partial [Pirellulales bacterium]|nr:sialate O-acetylesterase [Pirellulales bacterium]